MSRSNSSSLGHTLAATPWPINLLLAAAIYVWYLLWEQEVSNELSPNMLLPVLHNVLPIGSALLVLFAGLSWVLSFKRRRLLETQKSLESIRSLTWAHFERLAAEVFYRKGYTVEENFKGGADGGVDLWLKKEGKTQIVQCKRWKNTKVGVKPIRELFGVMMAEKASHAFFVCSGAYSKPALNFAQGKEISLIDGSALLELVKAVQNPNSEECETNEGMDVVRRSGLNEIDSMRPPEAGIERVLTNEKVEVSCAKCSSPMVERVAKRGKNAGSVFYGCSSYPKCRHTMNLSE